MKGYKVFNPDWTCRDFQYEVGKTYEIEEKPVICKKGFHFCTKAFDCFNYYTFNAYNKVAEVEALGIVDSNDDDSKVCTNKIKIVREISWYEVLDIVNTGKNNTGLCNTGDCNTGDKNIGDCNTGNRNTGNYNTGNYNAGNYNTGNYNAGNYNTGNYNAGDWNTGNCNAGDWNTGNCNIGNCNIGYDNTGNCNTGNYNLGCYNTGDYNIGDYNTGDWNKSDYNTGCFNTIEPTIMLFNKPSGITYKDWLNSDASKLLNKAPKNIVKWIYEKDMSEKEKENHPTYKTTHGYLKVLNNFNAIQLWWDSLTELEKDTIKKIPNFDKEIFEEIMGIKID